MVQSDAVLACPCCLSTLTTESKQCSPDNLFVALSAPNTSINTQKAVRPPTPARQPNDGTQSSASVQNKRDRSGSLKLSNQDPTGNETFQALECAQCGQLVGGKPANSVEFVLFDVLCTSAWVNRTLLRSAGSAPKLQLCSLQRVIWIWSQRV